MEKIRFEQKKVLVIYDEQGKIKEQIVVDRLNFVQSGNIIHLSVNGVKTIECQITDVIVDGESKIKHIYTPGFVLEAPAQ